jgi:hypothetical protein
MLRLVLSLISRVAGTLLSKKICKILFHFLSD